LEIGLNEHWDRNFQLIFLSRNLSLRLVTSTNKKFST
jgi:hypothetical protein